MTTMHDNRKDSFEVFFDEDSQDKFLKFLDEMEKDTHWEKLPAKDIAYVPMSDLKPEEVSTMDDVAYNDSLVSGFPVAMHLDDGRNFLLRPYLFKNIKQHHRDNAAVLSDMLQQNKYDDFCGHLNLSRPYLKKNVEICTRGGKVSGLFSDFNHNWSQLQQVSFFEETMVDKFPNFTFVHAEVSHYFTKAQYRLDMSMFEGKDAMFSPSVAASYLEAWEMAGGDPDELKKAVPTVIFMTGESGLSSIVVSPVMIMEGGDPVFLGASLSVNHRGKDEMVWDKFKAFPGEVATLYTKGMKGLRDMCKTEILHPYNCLTHVLKMFKSSIPKKELQELLDSFSIFYGEDSESSCMAIDIFNNVNETVNRCIRGTKMDPVKRLTNQETLARLCNADWTKLDQKRPCILFGKGDEAVTGGVDWLSM